MFLMNVQFHRHLVMRSAAIEIESFIMLHYARGTLTEIKVVAGLRSSSPQEYSQEISVTKFESLSMIR